MIISEQVKEITSNPIVSSKMDELNIRCMKFVQEMEQAGILNKNQYTVVNPMDVNTQQLKLLSSASSLYIY